VIERLTTKKGNRSELQRKRDEDEAARQRIRERLEVSLHHVEDSLDDEDPHDSSIQDEAEEFGDDELPDLDEEPRYQVNPIQKDTANRQVFTVASLRAIREEFDCEPTNSFRQAAALLNTPGYIDWADEHIPIPAPPPDSADGPQRQADRGSDEIEGVDTEATAGSDCGSDTPAPPRPDWEPEHQAYLDFWGIEALPYTVLSATTQQTMNSYVLNYPRSWWHPYKSYRRYSCGFNLYQRTFHLGSGPERLQWFIVMKPKPGTPEPEVSVAKGCQKSAMSRTHALQLAAFIRELIMESGSHMSHLAVPEEWARLRCGSANSVSPDHDDWVSLQKSLMSNWPIFIQTVRDDFWLGHDPTLHSYDFGQDQKLTAESLIRDPNDPACGGTLRNLEALYNPLSVATVSMAVAYNVIFDTPQAEEDEESIPQSTVFSTEGVRSQYPEPKKAKLRIFPTVFSPSVCSFQAGSAPEAYESSLVEPLNHCLTSENVGGNGAPIVSSSLTQGYMLLKQSVRPGPSRFELGKGFYTAALCSPEYLGASNAKKARNKMIESARDGTPIRSLLEGVETSMINKRVGSRLEVCLDIDFQAMKIENRTWSYVCEDIFTDVALWTRDATSQSLWPELLRMYDYEIFPGVMMEFAHIFDHVLKGLYRQWEREEGLGGVASEAVCTMERLSAYLFHGNEAHLPKRFWHWLGLTDSLEKYGWPGIDRQKIDFARLPAKRAPLPDLWPLEMDGELLFTQLAAVRFHFGPGVAARRVQELKRLTRSSVSSGGVAHNLLKEIVTCYMIPELRDFCLEGFKQKHATLTAQGTNSRLYAQDRSSFASATSKREMMLEEFSRSKTPFEKTEIMKMISHFYLVNPEDPASQLDSSNFPSSQPETLQTKQFVEMILKWSSDQGEVAGFRPGHLAKASMTWLTSMCELAADRSVISAEEWSRIIAQSLPGDLIHLLPGPYGGRLSSKRFIRLVHHTDTNPEDARVRAITARLTIRDVLDRQKERTSETRIEEELGISIPCKELPQRFLTGERQVNADLAAEGTFCKTVGSKKVTITKESVRNFNTWAYGMINLALESHQYVVLRCYALSSGPPLQPQPWGSGTQPTDLMDQMKPSARKERLKWGFLLLIRGILAVCNHPNPPRDCCQYGEWHAVYGMKLSHKK
jgi:hypothetical protein